MMSMQKAEAKYKAIFEALKDEILCGKYSATRKLPSEA
jgi:DNA-binding GntR family transcriptional regulator